MPLKHSPPTSATGSQLLSALASPLQHCSSDSNIAEIGKEAGLSAASSASSIAIAVKKGSGNKSALKRNRDEMEDISKSEVMNMFKALQKQQDDKFNRVLDSIGNLQTTVEFMSAKYEEALQRIEVLENEKKADKSYILHLENRLETQEHNARCTSIEIRNVTQSPKETKEDLKRVIRCAAQLFEIPLQNNEIKDVYRVNLKSSIKPIVVDFTTVFMRDCFLSAFKKYNKEHKHNRLNISNLNIEGDNKPVFISENLTQRERKLFYLAREFSKNLGYSFCWTSFGRVFLRKAEGSPQIRVFAESDLIKLREK